MLSQPSNASTAIHTSALEKLSPGPEHLELMSSRWRITDEQREEIRPTGKLTLTPEQKELSFADSFVTMAFDYGLQHYGAVRVRLGLQSGRADATAPRGGDVLTGAWRFRTRRRRSTSTIRRTLVTSCGSSGVISSRGTRLRDESFSAQRSPSAR